MNDHMDQHHQGRWKYGDPDVVYEGDDYIESESDISSSGNNNEIDSDEESSESGSGEDWFGTILLHPELLGGMS